MICCLKSGGELRVAIFTVVVTILAVAYGAANFLVISRVGLALPAGAIRKTTVSIMVTLALAYIMGRILEKLLPHAVVSPLIWGGSIWFAVLTYLFFFIAFSDILLKLAGLAGMGPGLRGALEAAVPWCAIVVAVGVSAYGAVVAMIPQVTRYDFSIAKQAGDIQDLSIAVVSDLHMGNIMGRRRVGRIVSVVNSLHPDLVLFPGDIVDEDLRPVMKQDLGALLKGINSKYGKFAVTGKHEYIGGAEKAVKYLESEGIQFLRDKTLTVADSFVLIGREDKSSEYFALKRRKPLEKIMEGVNRELPLILMDHQPYKLKEAEKAGIDLQLSGHTHNGQLWPFNWITRLIYEKSWGYLKKGSTNIVVSCGAGTWGPPVRVGSISEIVYIHLHFTGKQK